MSRIWCLLQIALNAQVSWAAAERPRNNERLDDHAAMFVRRKGDMSRARQRALLPARLAAAEGVGRQRVAQVIGIGPSRRFPIAADATDREAPKLTLWSPWRGRPTSSWPAGARRQYARDLERPAASDPELQKKR
jgi:hypothetical protein